MKFKENTLIKATKKCWNVKQLLIKMAFALVLVTVISCEDFIEIPPPITKLTSSTIFASDATATAAIVSIYIKMMESTDRFATRITLLAGLSADEFKDYSTTADQRQFYENGLVSNNSYISRLWSDIYQYIYLSNSLLEGLATAKSISPGIKNQLEGEAKFIRGFCYFYLVNLFGDVPLIMRTDYKANAVSPRTPAIQVYEQIITDMTDAESLLVEDYSYSNGERIRPNRWVATAMLARVYLYMGDWAQAELHATAVIDNVSLYGLSDDINSVFLKNSVETIWQLQPVIPNYNTLDGYLFILTSGPDFTSNVTLNDQVVGDFEPGDSRKTKWQGINEVGADTYYFPYKYKIKVSSSSGIVDEYLTVFRLAEQYLIRAEARTQQGELSDAIADIDSIRRRAGLPLINDTNPTISQADLLLAIEQERRIELFCEWGHRWLDLKRWNIADPILVPVKENWQSTDALYPIPQNEILRNPNMAPQNLGY